MATEHISSDNITFPAEWRAKRVPLLAAGAVLIVVSIFLFMTMGDNKTQLLFHSYLTNFMYCLTFCLGALFFVMVQHLVRAGWSAAVRRVAELYASTIPFWALLFLPILITLFGGSHDLYSWNQAADKIENPMVVDKLGYLNPKFFTLRTLFYFAVFIFAARLYFGMSRKQDETGDREITLKLQRWAGPMIALFSVSLNFAAFDWMMSTDPGWYSTIYGVYVFAASMLSFFAVMILTCYLLQSKGRLQKIVTTEHFHDMSKFQFGFIVFWSYIAFSQFLLYWYGNIPEETIWYKHRMVNGWGIWGLVLIATHFAVPFLGTVSRHVRRRPGLMAFWASFLLVVHWLDLTFLIIPNVEGVSVSVSLILAHGLCWIGMVLLFLGLFLWRVGETPVVALKDPWLPDSLAYHNLP